MPRPKQKKAEQVHVVRRWTQSQILFGRDSREMSDNPNYHPPISLTSTGRFITDAGETIAEKDVPDYVRKEAKATNLDIEYRAPKKRELSMRDAMLGAGVQDTDPARAFA